MGPSLRPRGGFHFRLAGIKINLNKVLYFYRLGSHGLPSSFGGSRGGRDDRFGGGRGGFGGGRGGGGFGGRKEKGSQPGSTLRKPKWDMDRLQKFEKNFYVEHPRVTNRSPVSILISYISTCPADESSQNEHKLV
jgi:hypothetical protein